MSDGGPSIGNWPPDYLDPIPEPPGIARELARAKVISTTAHQSRTTWQRETEARRTRAWVAYHDEHGWPDGECDYERRLRHAALAKYDEARR